MDNLKTKFMKPCILIIGLILLSGIAYAQEEESTPFAPKIRGAVMMAYSHVPQATEGEKSVAIIPTWGFDFDYMFHRHWSVGLQADLKLQDFEVEGDNVNLDRNYPFSVAAVGYYHALEHWSFFVGPGVELEKSENLFLVKIGTEYSFEISEKFEIALNFAYENRDAVYDGFTFGVAFNKLLWKKE